MKAFLKQLTASLLALLLVFAVIPAGAQQNVNNLSRAAGLFYATVYNWHGWLETGNTATGAVSVVLGPSQFSLPDGRQMNPFGPGNNLLTPVSFDMGANQETVTPTSVSQTTCPTTGDFSSSALCVTFTGTFAFTHGPHTVVASGSFGLQEAGLDAFSSNGGTVVVDKAWNGTNAMLIAAVPFWNVTILDTRGGSPVYWGLQGAAAALATPTTLVAATAGFGVNGANFTGGFYTGSNTYITCIAYVDIAGQEGPCSASFTVATSGALTTDQIGYTAPAASAGAVGYTIYITLNGGAYVSAYKVPLVTQPTVIGAYPLSNGVCVLTQIETVTPACAVANATYGQAGSGAVVSALTLNTSPIEPEASIVSTTTIFVPNPGGRSVYTYTPGSHIGTAGIPTAELAFPVSGSAATTVPTVLGTVNLPVGFMNYVGRTFEICGRAGITTGSTTTIVNIAFQWDAMGQNTAGKGVVIGNLGITPATAFATTEMDNFCETFQTTVASASATGGSINTAGGYIVTSGVTSAAAGQGAGGDPTTGATALLNLAEDARINIVYTHTTGTFAPTLQSVSFKVVN
jgi:hypothetical protein